MGQTQYISSWTLTLENIWNFFFVISLPIFCNSPVYQIFQKFQFSGIYKNMLYLGNRLNIFKMYFSPFLIKHLNGHIWNLTLHSRLLDCQTIIWKILCVISRIQPVTFQKLFSIPANTLRDWTVAKKSFTAALIGLGYRVGASWILKRPSCILKKAIL